MRSALAAALLLAASAAGAHAEKAAGARVVAQAGSSGIAGVRVQVLHTLAPQLVLENRGEHTLEILDDAGRAFLRIGPRGVEADLHAAAFYPTYSTAGLSVPLAARTPDAPPRWTLLKAEPAWGWFDPRLNLVESKVPAAVRERGVAAQAGSWQVPVRVDGQPQTLSGEFRWLPLARGRHDAQLLPLKLPAGLSVRLVAGNPPALFLENRTDATLTVLGLENEAWLRIGPQGVQADVASPTWRQYGRIQGLAVNELAGPQWQTISSRPAYTWLEPRAQAQTPPPIAAQRRPTQNWSVPLLLGTQPLSLQGTLRWLPDPSAH